MKKFGGTMLMLAGMFFSWPVLADGNLLPEHGGRMVEVDGSRLEMVITSDKVDLYVTDHDNKPVVVAGASAKVLFLTGGQKVEVPLQVTGENRFSGMARIPNVATTATVITVEGLPKRITARMPAKH